jgi:hypothetical protein
MRADERFRRQPREFWAQIKLISEELGYSSRGRDRRLRRYFLADIHRAFSARQLSVAHLGSPLNPTDEARLIVTYLNFRAEVLESQVEPSLMSRDEAKVVFEVLRAEMTDAQCKLPMNKQKGDKRHYSYLTCIVNLLTERALGPGSFVDDPHGLITFTPGGKPSRTFARRLDGAYPSINNPVACWEIKEYYGTTTFGSRVSGGVYETMLDGAEIEELRENTGTSVLHYLMVDDHFTWWKCGRSYLCRMVDMLNIGSVDEILFGREVLIRWPEIVASFPRRARITDRTP